jgi:acyl-coenzyme A synthetase/AMP-(fatty) acid ligase
VGGHVFFKGRIDFQVKVNGYRLELGEVAAAIRACGWSDVCVVMWRSQLSAVIEAPGAGALDVQELRRQLADKLEPHAIPAVLRTIPTLPRNANDKIDSAAVNAWLEASAQAAAKE